MLRHQYSQRPLRLEQLETRLAFDASDPGTGTCGPLTEQVEPHGVLVDDFQWDARPAALSIDRQATYERERLIELLAADAAQRANIDPSEVTLLAEGYVSRYLGSQKILCIGPSDTGSTTLHFQFLAADRVYGYTTTHAFYVETPAWFYGSRGTLDYHDESRPMDVNGDGIVTMDDVTLVIADLTEHGSRQLPFDSSVVVHIDVNGDSHATPQDVLRIVNQLRRGVTSFDESTQTWTFDPSVGTVGTGSGILGGNLGLGHFLLTARGIDDGEYTFDFLYEIEGGISVYHCEIPANSPVQTLQAADGLVTTSFVLNSCDVIDTYNIFWGHPFVGPIQR